MVTSRTVGGYQELSGPKASLWLHISQRRAVGSNQKPRRAPSTPGRHRRGSCRGDAGRAPERPELAAQPSCMEALSGSVNLQQAANVPLGLESGLCDGNVFDLYSRSVWNGARAGSAKRSSGKAFGLFCLGKVRPVTGSPGVRACLY